MQLSFLDTCLTKESKRKAEKLMSRYKVLEAIIESRKLRWRKSGRAEFVVIVTW